MCRVDKEIFLKDIGTSMKVDKLVSGCVLKTNEGSKTVVSVDKVIFDYNTPVYDLVVSGSHTYVVNGYAVSGWVRDDDFDYKNWKNKGISLTINDYYPSHFGVHLL